MSWITPIVDRSEVDIENAKKQIKEWINGTFTNLPDLKGCLNPSDLNRIESNIETISDSLLSLGIYNHIDKRGSWTYADIPKTIDVKRIIDNVKVLYDSCLSEIEVNYPNGFNHYTDVNKIEQIILDLRNYIVMITNSYIKCGTVWRTATLGKAISKNITLSTTIKLIDYQFVKCGTRVCGE